MNFFPQPKSAKAAKPTSKLLSHFHTFILSHLSTIQHPRVSASRNRRGKSKIQNCDVLTLTPSPLNPRIPRRLPAAFSLTEVVIAMGVAAVAFTSIIALFPLGLNMSKESYEATQAALIAQTILADAKDQQFGASWSRPYKPTSARLIQIADNSDPRTLANFATVNLKSLTPENLYIAYKPKTTGANDTDPNNPTMLRPSGTNTLNQYITGSNGAYALVKVTFSPIGEASAANVLRRVDISVETPGSANISNRTCTLFTGAIRE